MEGSARNSPRRRARRRSPLEGSAFAEFAALRFETVPGLISVSGCVTPLNSSLALGATEANAIETLRYAHGGGRRFSFELCSSFRRLSFFQSKL
jgi:hypothetical protein